MESGEEEDGIQEVSDRDATHGEVRSSTASSTPSCRPQKSPPDRERALQLLKEELQVIDEVLAHRGILGIYVKAFFRLKIKKKNLLVLLLLLLLLLFVEVRTHHGR